MSIAADLEIHRLSRINHIVVVVIAGAQGPDTYDTVLAMVALFKTKLLPQGSIGIYKERTGIIQPSF